MGNHLLGVNGTAGNAVHDFGKLCRVSLGADERYLLAHDLGAVERQRLPMDRDGDNAAALVAEASNVRNQAGRTAGFNVNVGFRMRHTPDGTVSAQFTE